MTKYTYDAVFAACDACIINGSSVAYKANLAIADIDDDDDDNNPCISCT